MGKKTRYIFKTIIIINRIFKKRHTTLIAVLKCSNIITENKDSLRVADNKVEGDVPQA